MKKLICILLAILLLTLSGCSRGNEVIRNDKYKIVEHKGEYALQLHDPAAYSSPSDSGDVLGNAPVHTIVFPSVAKLKEALESGTFSDSSLAHMRSNFAKSRIGGIKICNPFQLYEAVLPEGLSAGGVQWFGDAYVFPLGDHGALRFTDKEGHDDFAKTRDIESGKAKILSVTTTEDRNAKVVAYENLAGAPRKMVTYSHTSGGKTITVAEQYNLDESETVPYRISFWGSCDGAYFTGYMYQLDQRPSYEWVTSFGLKPYTEAE